MELFHGTIRTFAERIKRDGIDVTINKGVELDFGMGFYFSDEKTASKLAVKKSEDMIAREDVDSTPVLLHLEVDINSLRQMKSISFTSKNRQWFDFVFAARSTLMESGHDFIEGPMADGGVDTIVGLYVAHPNIFTKFLVWANFMWIDGYGHTQYIAKTPEALSHVKTGVITEVKL